MVCSRMTKVCSCCACWIRPSLSQPEFQRGAGNPKPTWTHNGRTVMCPTEVGPKLVRSVKDAPFPERHCVLTSPGLKPRALHGEQSRGHLVGGELLFRQPVARKNVIEGEGIDLRSHRNT